MKKDKHSDTEAAEANIRLNEIMNEDNKVTYNMGASSTTEANIAIQEAFYSEDTNEDVLPTYIANNNTSAIIINDKDNR